ncbi:ATP-binding protein [Echinicola marina]|uniref:ATP-binding protein n=1 Tax=Echinicola marina TaxID=2859768 RepID=UPI001CF6FFEC|nr:ATP-binding protein [Echinicola marina]UCS94111.1 ATP-binding protein [Echinicola marina]
MKHELTLYCEKNKLAELRTFLDKELSTSGLTDVVKNELILAVEEVCANRIIHSHGCNPSNHLRIKVKKLHQRIIFEIIDSGEAFDMLTYEEPRLKDVIKDKRKGGLGIKLVKTIMDTIEIESKNSHNICRLIKQLNSK